MATATAGYQATRCRATSASIAGICVRCRSLRSACGSRCCRRPSTARPPIPNLTTMMECSRETPDHARRPARPLLRHRRVLVVDDGNIADLVRAHGDDAATEIYVHPADAPAFIARWF